MGCTGGKFVSEETRINRALRQRYFDARRAYHDELREASFCSNRSMRRSNMEFLARQQSEAMASGSGTRVPSRSCSLSTSRRR